MKLEKDNNEHLYRVMVEGNRKTWTYSCWIKRTELLQVNAQVLIHFGVNHHATRMFIDDNNDQIYLDVCSTENTLYRSITNRRFRDTSAWYHIVWRMDTTQGTEADRMRLYINGVEETSWSQHQIPPQNLETLANTTAGGYDDMGIGTYVWAGSSFDGQFSGYIAQVAHVDGQSYAPTEFGEFDDDSGIWKPKDVSGLTYGTSNNSFFLDFETASDLGANAKGNDVNFSLNNITAADQATDTPTNNFCTLNVIANIENNAVVFTEGATVGSVSGGGNVSDHAMATMGFSSGKWYYEAYVTTGSTNDDAMFGFANPDGWYQGLGNDTFSAGAHNVGRWYYNSNTFTTTGATTWDKGDIVQIAIDCDNGKCWSGVNGTYSSGDPSTNTGGFDWDANVTDMSIGDLVIPVTRVLYTAPGTTYYNFGGYTLIPISSAASDANGYGTFEYAPPTGFYAICGKNLAEYGGTA